MAATTDFVHDEQIVDAVISALEANLPAAWLDTANPLWGLKRIEFGDLREYRFSGRDGDASVRDLLPSILVRTRRSEDASREYGGIGGKTGRRVPIRVVHIFGDPQRRDETTASKWIQPARARAQRATVISEALFQDRRLGGPSLSTNDSSARVIECRPVGIYYDVEENAGEVYAVAVDIEVTTHTA